MGQIAINDLKTHEVTYLMKHLQRNGLEPHISSEYGLNYYIYF